MRSAALACRAALFAVSTLAVAAASLADPAAESRIDMVIHVHPAAEVSGDAAETVSRVERMLEHATDIVHGLDPDSALVPPDDFSCPVRFRAIDVRRMASSIRGPYGCPATNLRPAGDAFLTEQGFGPGAADGCTSPATGTVGVSVGPGLAIDLSELGRIYAHEIGHLAAGPESADHAGYEGTLLGGPGAKNLRVPPSLCKDFQDLAAARGAPGGTAACVVGSGVPPDPDPYTVTPRFSACAGEDGWCDGEGRCVAAPAACVDGVAPPTRGKDCSAAGHCRACTGSRAECVPCASAVAPEPGLPAFLAVDSSAEGEGDLLIRITPHGNVAELDHFATLPFTATGLARAPATGTLYTVSPQPGGPDRLHRIDPDGTVALVGSLGLTGTYALAYADDANLLYGLVAGPGGPQLAAIDPSTGSATAIGAIAAPPPVLALAFDSSESELLLLATDGASNPNVVYALDRTDASVAPSGIMPFDALTALAYDAAGDRLFGSAVSGYLYDLDFSWDSERMVGFRPTDLVVIPACGNAIVETGEACDDGNHSTATAADRCAGRPPSIRLRSRTSTSTERRASRTTARPSPTQASRTATGTAWGMRATSAPPRPTRTSRTETSTGSATRATTRPAPRTPGRRTATATASATPATTAPTSPRSTP